MFSSAVYRLRLNRWKCSRFYSAVTRPQPVHIVLCYCIFRPSFTTFNKGCEKSSSWEEALAVSWLPDSLPMFCFSFKWYSGVPPLSLTLASLLQVVCISALHQTAFITEQLWHLQSDPPETLCAPRILIQPCLMQVFFYFPQWTFLVLYIGMSF